ncbi:uncharacterized protein LOC102424454 [Myotis lucifugus]|uniref:uncharacterized protein LOC102424454 n=1 Tax=Myotis lucifugus TaxID=59463 RepID=UPI000CCBE0DA|nr:uncharacterized protein LOC102424454 [Myotis lucifugus]
MQLENGTLIKNGSCVAPKECPEGVYALTYAPNSSLSTACCDNNCSRVARPEEAQPNGVKCHYCSGNKPAPCDSLSVMSCTGHQTACVTLKGTWNRDTRATSTHSKAKATTCFTCSDSDHCHPFSCPAERSYCLQTAGILALGEGDSVAWRNGSCVASKDCRFDSPISALTYSIGFGFWVNTTCCQGSCQEPPPPATLPASRTLSKFLCPICADSHLGLCNSSLYMQCPSGETTCVQLDLVSEEGGRNLSVRGCGSRDLCSAPHGTEGLRALPGHRLARRPDCSSSKRAVIDSSSSLAQGPGLALPALVALVARALA